MLELHNAAPPDRRFPRPIAGGEHLLQLIGRAVVASKRFAPRTGRVILQEADLAAGEQTTQRRHQA